MTLGANPIDTKSLEVLVKSKDIDILALKKSLKDPNLEHVQMSELLAIQKGKK